MPYPPPIGRGAQQLLSSVIEYSQGSDRDVRKKPRLICAGVRPQLSPVWCRSRTCEHTYVSRDKHLRHWRVNHHGISRRIGEMPSKIGPTRAGVGCFPYMARSADKAHDGDISRISRRVGRINGHSRNRILIRIDIALRPVFCDIEKRCRPRGGVIGCGGSLCALISSCSGAQDKGRKAEPQMQASAAVS